MGKYIGRNSKTTGEVSLIDVPSYASVRARAKTLALQKAAESSTAAGSYIQLRSRRLVKPTAPKRQKENRVPQKSNKSSFKGANSSGVRVISANSSISVKKLSDRKEEIRHERVISDAEGFGINDEGSFGENMLGEEEADVKEGGIRIPFSPFSPFRLGSRSEPFRPPFICFFSFRCPKQTV
ncbi:hypothetical protein R6Q59_011443 [Mikania micrantha]